jgi:hypothetical protein
VETLEQYLDRKQQELSLLNKCLSASKALQRPRSIAQVIREKFRLAAELKAEHALRDWAHTETAWFDADRYRSGAFEFAFGYQRRICVCGDPPFMVICCRTRGLGSRTRSTLLPE